MPMFDFTCPKCEKMHTEIYNPREYDEFECTTCKHCGAKLTKEHRLISRSISVIINGTTKGNHNSNDYS